MDFEGTSFWFREVNYDVVSHRVVRTFAGRGCGLDFAQCFQPFQSIFVLPRRMESLQAVLEVDLCCGDVLAGKEHTHLVGQVGHRVDAIEK